MKLKLFILIIVILATILVFTIPAIGQSGSELVVDNTNIMIVVYRISDQEIIGYTRYDDSLVIADNSIVSRDLKISGIDWSEVGYGLYEYQEIGLNDASGVIHLYDLALQPVQTASLPHSQHIARLKSINPSNAYPAIVTRLWMGTVYDIPCLVSQSVVNLYIAGQVKVGDYVIVSFIDEHPYTQERSIAIVVDKVYKSW